MTVSKTTTQEHAKEFARKKCIAPGMWLESETAEFADSLTAELQKEKAAIAKALGIHFCPDLEEPWEVSMEPEPDYFETLPEAAAFLLKLLDKGLSDREKENARLREALEKIMGCVGTSTESRHIARAALSEEPPKGGAVQKGLSKEKAKGEQP